MKKIKKITKSDIFFFTLGALVFSSISVVFAYSINATNVGITPTETSWQVDNVYDALEYIHDVDLEILMSLSSDKFNGTYKQAHGTSSNNLTSNFTKGTYFIMLYYSYGGGVQANNYSSITADKIGITPTNGTCKVIDGGMYQSGGNSVAYSSNYRFRNIFRYSFYMCSFTDNGSVVTSTYGTNQYDPDTYVMRYIKIREY